MPKPETNTVINNEIQNPNPSYFQLLNQVFVGLSKNYQSGQTTQNEEFHKSIETQSKILEEFWNKETKKIEPFKRINLDEITVSDTYRTTIKKNGKIITVNDYGSILTTFNQNGQLEKIHSETTTKPDTNDKDRVFYDFEFNNNKIASAQSRIIKYNQVSMMPQLESINQITF